MRENSILLVCLFFDHFSFKQIIMENQYSVIFFLDKVRFFFNEQVNLKENLNLLFSQCLIAYRATQKIAKQAKTRSQISSLGANTNSISSSSTNQGPARLMSPNQIAAISNDDVHPFDTNFGLSLTRNPPSAPPGLFRNVDRRTSTAGKVLLTEM